VAAALQGKGVHRVRDLLWHWPIRYEDRSRVVSIAELARFDEPVLVLGTVRSISTKRSLRRRIAIVEALVEDSTGALPVVWFNQAWMGRQLRVGQRLFLYGVVRQRGDRGCELVGPEVEKADDQQDGLEAGVVPVYPRLGPLGGRRLRRIIRDCVSGVSPLRDPLPEDLRDRLGLISLDEALIGIHAPDPGDQEELGRLGERRSACHSRLVFDELLAFSCGVVGWKVQRQGLRSPVCRVTGELRKRAQELLPFRLTGAQRRVVAEIASDLTRPYPMARLLQGDVGSGKTAVAALALLLVEGNGHQAALMAPTELLAEQQHRVLAELFARIGIEVGLLSSSLPGRQQEEVIKSLQSGRLRIVVGTHSLIQEKPRFHRLGLVVVDEQHRFGVLQRQALVDKGAAPHVLVMTATPIPRSLALTLYGDLEVSVIDELPPGRAPVTTVLRSPAVKDRLFAFLRSEINEGGRVFVVYPLIEASLEVNAEALESHVEELRRALPGCHIGVLHGRVPRQERELIYGRFRRGETPVLMATTLVEVGIDVPEATVMVVESADRFGLAQLHQLRGRVGRGSRHAWCVLLAADDIAPRSRERLLTFCRTTDGFEIAEADLRMRGAGEIDGVRQWGRSRFRLADPIEDRDLLARARGIADELAANGRLEEVRAALAPFHDTDFVVPSG
jgi:ATP-dependent DNA helicase RecG